LSSLPSTLVVAALLQPPSMRPAQAEDGGGPASVLVALEQAICEALSRRPKSARAAF
jgi:hypothetical protein